MAKRADKIDKDVDYTVPALVAIVAAVLITALFFASPHSESTVAGAAGYAPATNVPVCEPSSYCVTRNDIERQAPDCSIYKVHCQDGCIEGAQGAFCL